MIVVNKVTSLINDCIRKEEFLLFAVTKRLIVLHHFRILKWCNNIIQCIRLTNSEYITDSPGCPDSPECPEWLERPD